VFEIKEAHIPENLKVVIYRVLQEALNNVAKHSNANQVSISLRKTTNKTIVFSIKDNGKGFDVDATLSPENQRNGLGLISLIKRAELSGGSLVITSDKETGTIIRASWPST
jgi:signal transduction histidine kinase